MAPRRTRPREGAIERASAGLPEGNRGTSPTLGDLRVPRLLFVLSAILKRLYASIGALRLHSSLSVEFMCLSTVLYYFLLSAEEL